MRTAAALVFALLLIIMALSSAAQNRDRTRNPFSRMDANGDGYVSKDEYRGDPAMFDRVDANKDGKLDADEMANVDWRALQQEMAAARLKETFQKADKDKDGKLSQTEYTEYSFTTDDVNKDGFITDEDRQTGMFGQPNRQPREATDTVRPGGNQTGRSMGGMWQWRTQAELKRYDKDKDGKFDKKEYTQLKTDEFKRLDKDKDGFLTQEELAARDQMRGGFGEMIGLMDTSGDGKISKEEWAGDESYFARLDRNGDGYIDKDEVPQFGQGGPGGPGGFGPRRGGSGGSGGNSG